MSHAQAVPVRLPGEVDHLEVQGQQSLPRTGDLPGKLGLLAFDDSAEVLQLSLNPELPESVGESVRGERLGAVHEVEVEVREVRIAGAAEQSEDLSGPDPVTHLDLGAARLQVGVEGVAAVVQADHDIVATGPPCG